MFEHFSLGAQPQPRHLHDDPDVSAPPTDVISAKDGKQKQREVVECSAPETPAINDLSHQLTDSNLHPEGHGIHESVPAVGRSDAGPCNTNTVSASPCEDDSDDYDYDNEAVRASMTYHSTTRGLTSIRYINTLSGPVSGPSEGEADCKRLLRQINTQLQSCEKHVKDIETLIDNMISTGEQCTLHTPVLRQQHPSTQSSSIPNSRADTQQDAEEDDPGDEELLDGVSSTIPIIEPEMHIQQDFDADDEGFADLTEDDFLVLEASITSSFQDSSTGSGIRKRLIHPSVLKARGLGDGMSNSYQAKGKPRLRSVARMRKRREGGPADP